MEPEDAEAMDVARILTNMHRSSTDASNIDQRSSNQALSLPSYEESGSSEPSNPAVRSSFSTSLMLDMSEQQPSDESARVAPANSSSRSAFSIFDALLSHDDILLYLTTQHVEPHELFVLYQISKPFHYIVNSQLTSYILSSARRWARLTAFRPSSDVDPAHHLDSRSRTTASRRLMHASGTEPTPPGVYSYHDITTILPFHNYLHLCTVDPAQKPLFHRDSLPLTQKPATYLTSEPTDGESSTPAEQGLRNVPTFRYLRFVLNRARTIQLIIHHLAQQGHRLPVTETPAILAKLSLTLDIPTNTRRFALFRSKRYWPDRDLYAANLFLIKVDMAFTDPVDGNGETTLRKLLLSQRGLEMLEGALSKTQCKSLLDTLQVLVRTWHCPAPQHRGYDILGVPASEVGKTGLEGWGLAEPPGLGAGLCTDESKDGGGNGNDKIMQDAQLAGQDQPQPAVPEESRRRAPLIRPDELIIAEAMRRHLPLHQYYIDMMSYGYLDPDTLENLSDPAAASVKRAGKSSPQDGVGGGDARGQAGGESSNVSVATNGATQATNDLVGEADENASGGVDDFESEAMDVT